MVPPPRWCCRGCRCAPGFSPRPLGPCPWPLAPGQGFWREPVGISPERCREGCHGHPSSLPRCPLLPVPKALLREGAQEKPVPGRGQGRCCWRLPCGSAAVPLLPLPAPLGRRPGPPPPAASDRLRVPAAPRKTHTVPGTRPGYPAHSNKQTETRPVAKPTDGKLSNDFFFQALKRQGAPGEGKRGASISRPGWEGGQSRSRSGSVRPSVLPDDGTGTRAGVVGVFAGTGREGGDGGS